MAGNVIGLRDFHKGLREIERTLPRELNKGARRAVVPALARARALAPHRTGALAKSIKPYATQRGVGLRSAHPAANWLHWGGHIEPRGVPIWRSEDSPGARFAIKALEETTPVIVAGMGAAFVDVARKAGFNQ